jgi:hypothetical protein
MSAIQDHPLILKKPLTEDRILELRQYLTLHIRARGWEGEIVRPPGLASWATRRRVLVTGMVVFVASLVACGLAMLTLGGTRFGLAVFFSGAMLAYEAVQLFRALGDRKGR